MPPDLCDTLDDWDDMDTQERLDFLADFVNDYLADEGYGPVTVTSGPEPDGRSGSWNESTHTVNFDDTHLRDDPAADALDTAIHEAAHAEHDYEHPGETIPPGYNDNYEKYTVEWDDDGNPVVMPPGTPIDLDHRDIYQYAADLLQMILDACDDGDDESGAREDLPPGDWVLPGSETAYA